MVLGVWFAKHSRKTCIARTIGRCSIGANILVETIQSTLLSMQNLHLKNTFIPDIIAGLTVSFAALSLGAAFGTMSGRGAFAGMIGAAVIPILTSVFGGTRLQASGPTAPMTAVSALMIAQAYEAFPDSALAEQFITLVFLLNAAILALMGILKTGRFIRLVPNVVILGFMNGIGLLIWADQAKRMFGWGGKARITGDFSTNLIIALGTLTCIYAIPWLLKSLGVPLRVRKYLPGMFLTIIIGTVLTSAIGLDVERVNLGNSVSGLNGFISMVTGYFPMDTRLFTADVLIKALPCALQLTLLAYLDSLLTSLVIDKMTGETSRQDKELIAQGAANGLSAMLQGIPGAQATIRSVLLLKEGAQTRLAGVMVGVFALFGFLVFGKYITQITAAVFVGVLLKAGLDVLDRDFVLAYIKNHWVWNRNRNIQLMLIVFTTLVTVFFDLNLAVFAGTVIFYIGKQFAWVSDSEDEFEVVHLPEEAELPEPEELVPDTVNIN